MDGILNGILDEIASASSKPRNDGILDGILDFSHKEICLYLHCFGIVLALLSSRILGILLGS